jgi:hypothetical protein
MPTPIDHSAHNSPASLRSEIFRLKALLTKETKEKLETADLCDHLRRENNTLERRVANLEALLLDQNRLLLPDEVES